MPTPTYTPLATVTLGSSASSVTFSSIPATYRDLVLVFNGTNTGGTLGLFLRFNGDSGSNYTGVAAQGDGSSAASGTFSGDQAEIGVITANRTMSITQIMDYSATDKHKTFLTRSDGPNDRTRMTASRYASTSALTSVQAIVGSGNFAAGARLDLYGIKA